MVNVDALYERFFHLGDPYGRVASPSEAGPQFRRKVTSLRLQGCQLLAKLVRERQPARVLDLGSGVTTHVLRALVAEFPGMVVTTTDHMDHWLARTVLELQRDGLGLDRCFRHDDFLAAQSVNLETFDLISVDTGNTAFRIDMVPELVKWLAPAGILVLDDFGPAMEPYGTNMTAALESRGLAVEYLPDTLDQFDCAVAVATWRPTE